MLSLDDLDERNALVHGALPEQEEVKFDLAYLMEKELQG